MKNKIYLTLGMVGLLVLSGCSGISKKVNATPEVKDSPKIVETIIYRDNVQQAQPNSYGGTPAPMGGNNAAHYPQPQQMHGHMQQHHNQQAAPIITSTPPVAQPQPQLQPQPQVQHVIVQKPEPRKEKIKITGVGYGAESTYEGFTQGQRRLMAIRASKLDAYRALAEQLYGIKIDSNTSVATLTAQSDSFRARVNAVVKGARIVSITPMADNNYETVLEVFVDRTFFEDVFVYTGNKQDHVLEAIETCTMGFNCYEAANYR